MPSSNTEPRGLLPPTVSAVACWAPAVGARPAVATHAVPTRRILVAEPSSDAGTYPAAAGGLMLVAQRLAGGERMGDALLRLGIPQELQEVLALERENPLLVHLGTGLHIAAGHDFGDP